MEQKYLIIIFLGLICLVFIGAIVYWVIRLSKKSKPFRVMSIITVLAVSLSCVIWYNISHREWIKMCVDVKERFPFISEISYDKPTPALYITFDVDTSVDFNDMEKIFLCFLDSFDEDFLNEIIKNTGSHKPMMIDVCFSYISDTESSVLVFKAKGHDYFNWKCIFLEENNDMYCREYTSHLLVNAE